MSRLPSLICRFSAISITILASYSVNTDKLILKFIWKIKRPRITNAILKNKEKWDYPTSRLTIKYNNQDNVNWWKNRHIDWWIRTRALKWTHIYIVNCSVIKEQRQYSGERMCLESPHPSLTHMTSKLALLLVGSSVPLHMGLTMALLECSHNTVQLSPEGEIQAGWSVIVFYDLASEVTHHHFCNILLVTWFIPDSMCEEAASWHGYWDCGSLCAVLKAAYQGKESPWNNVLA